MTSLFDHIMNLAREAGADSPQLGENSDGEPVVVDLYNQQREAMATCKSFKS
jgi:hypothetical protein